MEVLVSQQKSPQNGKAGARQNGVTPFYGHTDAGAGHTLVDEGELTLRVKLASWRGLDKFCSLVGLPGAPSSGGQRGFLQVLQGTASWRAWYKGFCR